MREVEFAGQDQARKAARIAGLLSRQSGFAQLFVAAVHQFLEINRLAQLRDQLVPHRSCGGDTHLLPDDRAKERFDTGLTDPGFRLSVGIQNRGECFFSCRERIEAFVEGFGGADHQATLAA